MITLDFEIDEPGLAQDCLYSPEAATRAALEETYFLASCRFSVEGVELLGLPGKPPGLPLPLLGLASHLYRVSTALRPGETRKCYLAGGGELTFARKNGSVRISSSLTGNTATVDIDDLVKAARSLLERARDVLLQRLPGMQAHPSWADWFPK